MSDLATLGPNGWETRQIVKRGVEVLAQSAVPASVTGTISETVLATIPIPAGAMGVDGSLRVTTLWSYTNSANIKNCRVKIGSTVISVFSQTATAGMQRMDFLRNRGSLASQVAFPNSTNPFGTTTAAVPTYAFDMSVEQILTLTGELANPGETITLQGYTIELLNP